MAVVASFPRLKSPRHFADIRVRISMKRAQSRVAMQPFGYWRFAPALAGVLFVTRFPTEYRGVVKLGTL